MASCKECIHYERCIGLDDYNRMQKLAMRRGCGYFKDRSRFVELPCKVGDTVYAYCEELHELLEYTVECVVVYRENALQFNANAYDDENDEALDDFEFTIEDIGKDVFLTREEAEQALKEREVSA